MTMFLVGFVSAFVFTFLVIVGWWFLINYRRPRSHEQVEAEFQRVRRAVLHSINSEPN